MVQPKKKKTREKKKTKAIGDLQDNIKCSNIQVIGVLEGEAREKGAENIFKDIIAENFPNLGKETKHRVPNRINPKRATPKCTVINTANIKEKENIKSSKGKTTNNRQGNSHKVNS